MPPEPDSPTVVSATDVSAAGEPPPAAPDTPLQPSANSIGHVLRGFGGLAASNIVSQLIAFAALVYVARRVGAANLGAYSFALSLVTYVGLFANLGVSYLATREVAQNHATARQAVGESLQIQLTLALLLYVALVATAPVLVSDHTTRRMLPLVGLLPLTTVFTVDWVLLALGRPGTVAIWRLIGQVAYALPIPLIVVAGATGALRYAFLNIVGLAVTGFGLAFAFVKLVGFPAFGASLRALAHRARRSLPFGYVLLMLQIYGAVAVLMLGYLDSTHAVGVYAIAYKLPASLIVLANIWLNVFFPHTARQMQEDRGGLARDLGRVITATVIISAAVVVGAALVSHSLMPALFGSRFRSAAGPFAILAVAGALVLIEASFSNVLLAAESQRFYMVTLTATAVLVVALNATLIPTWGVRGAAVATVTGEAFLTLVTFIGVRRYLGRVTVDGDRLVRGAVAIGIMAAAMIISGRLAGLLAELAAGTIVLGLSCWKLDVFDVRLLAR